MLIRLNGIKKEVPEGTTVESLIQLFQLGKKSVVFELNQQVVNRNSYSLTQLKENDTLEIVHFVGGG